jgi:hypothetical protein
LCPFTEPDAAGAELDQLQRFVITGNSPRTASLRLEQCSSATAEEVSPLCRAFADNGHDRHGEAKSVQEKEEEENGQRNGLARNGDPVLNRYKVTLRAGFSGDQVLICATHTLTRLTRSLVALAHTQLLSSCQRFATAMCVWTKRTDGRFE